MIKLTTRLSPSEMYSELYNKENHAQYYLNDQRKMITKINIPNLVHLADNFLSRFFFQTFNMTKNLTLTAMLKNL